MFCMFVVKQKTAYEMLISDGSSDVCSSDHLIFAADHEAGDMLEEQQGNAPLAGEFDEMRALLRAFAEQHAVIGQDRYRHAPYMGEAADERGAVKRLELVKFAAVDDAGDDFAHVIGGADEIGRAHV